jgi:hypothetical protein
MIAPGLMRAVAEERERELARRAAPRRPAHTDDASRTALLRGRLAVTALAGARS